VTFQAEGRTYVEVFDNRVLRRYIASILRAPLNSQTKRHRVLGRIFGPNKNEVTGDWGKLCNMILIVMLTYYWYVQITNSEFDVVCNTYGVNEKCVYYIDQQTERKTQTLKT
jgi:hypothetical protein